MSILADALSSLAMYQAASPINTSSTPMQIVRSTKLVLDWVICAYLALQSLFELLLLSFGLRFSGVVVLEADVEKGSERNSLDFAFTVSHEKIELVESAIGGLWQNPKLRFLE